jgi:hypothetical protein
MTKTKSNKEDNFTTIDFDCDNKTLKSLRSIAKLACVTLDQVVSVILAAYIVNEKGFKTSFKPVDQKSSKGSAKLTSPSKKISKKSVTKEDDFSF